MASKKTTLLLDGDILAFRSVAVHYHEIEWEPDLWTYHTDLTSAKATMEGLVKKLTDKVEPDDVLVCITGAGQTFRHRLWPTYKGNRKQKPPGYRAFQDWLQERFTTYLRPGLEADDSLGILMTADDIVPGLKVLWSADKDLGMIPGFHLGDDGMVREVVPDEGAWFHAYQTLIGDTTDNYPGLKGFGPAKARALMDKHQGHPVALWAAIQAQYEKAGFTREDMLVQARVARILTADLFDFDNKQPILWEPPT